MLRDLAPIRSRCPRRTRRALAWLLPAILLAAPPLAGAVTVAQFAPQGTVAQAREVHVRFSDDVVALGGNQAAAPLRLDCGASGSPAGQGRWISPREWVFQLSQKLPAGSRCVAAATDDFRPLPGEWTGARSFSFEIAAPSVLRTTPWQGSRVEESQQFLLELSGAPAMDSIAGHAWCEVEGLGERIPALVLPDAQLQATLKALRRDAAGKPDRGSWLLLACQRPLTPGARMTLVWGAGIGGAANPAVTTRGDQRLQFQVRDTFTAEFSCEREHANAPCIPVLPMRLGFSAPVPRELALMTRLIGPDGKRVAPTPLRDPKAATVDALQFPAPLPESSSFRIEMAPGLKDDSGRALSNASMFPLQVRTGAAPPLAKFAAAPFGIIEREADGPAVVPITLRQVQAELQPGAKPEAAQLLDKTLHTDAEVLQAFAALREADAHEWDSRKTPLLSEADGARRLQLPARAPTAPTEVIGIPIAEPGYHLLELSSPVLGRSLLDKPQPMYVRTGVLVTNLGVHIKLGRENSLVWVTTLDRAKPVADAAVTVNDCNGRPLWSGRTDAQGRAQIERALEGPNWRDKCLAESGLFITARKRDAQGVEDMAFAFSNWSRGIEPWRFDLPTGAIGGGGEAQARAHTVLDRSLLRPGETVSMKHFFRLETLKGLAAVPPERLPTRLKIVHQGSGQEFVQPLQWSGGRYALSSWAIPPDAKLGLYSIVLERVKPGDKPASNDGDDDAESAERRWESGSFRVAEFRVPLVDARLMPPKGDAVRPASLQFDAQLNHQTGGPMGQAAVHMSALLRPRFPNFAGYEGYNFAPPQGTQAVPSRSDDDDEPSDDDTQSQARLVADKLAATTDAHGAAHIVVPKLPAIDHPAELQAELSYRDPNGVEQTVSKTIPLWPARVVLGIRSASWGRGVGPMSLQTVALDLQGRPIAGQKITVQGRLRETLSTRKRMVGGFYAYDNRVELKELGTLCSGTTDAQGLLPCEVDLAMPGEVELIARSADADGHAAEAATSVWITAKGELWFEQDNDDRMDVLADKRAYEPGETAHLQVRMPFRFATVLVSVEREGVIDSWVQTLAGKNPTIDIKVDKAWAPNVYVSVLALRGRVREVPWYSFFTWGWRDPRGWWQEWRNKEPVQAPTAMVDLGKPAFKFGVAKLGVGLAEHQLQVQVTPEKPQYGVRQTARVRVKVSLPSTAGGGPAAGAQVAFAAVDEGLLALSPNDSWDLLKSMLQERAWSVATATAQSEIVGRRHFGRKAVAAGGGGGHAARELFDTLLLWKPAVQLDANGEAVVDVPLNDSLTSFRLVAVADAGPDRFGTGAASVRVSQDLQLLSGLPPMVREGDRFQAMVTVRNASSHEMKLYVTLAARGDAGGTLKPAAQDLVLAAGAARELQWPLTAPVMPGGAGKLSWEVQASEAGGAAQDRLVVVQAVQAAEPLRVQQSVLMQLDGALTVPVAAPPTAVADQGRARGGVELGWQPKLSGALPGLRRFFETYPYSCLEQQSSKNLGLHDDGAWTALMARLPTYLDADGLASYFPPRSDAPAQGSDVLTAYVLAAANEAGQAVPEPARTRMLDGLAAFVDGRIQRRYWSPREDVPIRRLIAIEALSRYGRASPRMLATVDASLLHTWPTSAVIDWLLIQQRVPDAPNRAAQLQQAGNELRSRLSWAGSTLKFASEDSDGWWWLMAGADANASRLILAVLDDPGWKADIPRLVQGTLARQVRGAWQTTTANFWGVMALEKFSAKFESQAVAGRSTAQLDAASSTQDWSKQPKGGTQQLPWPLRPAALQVRHEGTGKPWLTVQSLAAVPLTAPMNAGYVVRRSVVPVEQKDKARWSRGDVMRVHLEIEAANDMSWVVISDPVPAGATILGAGLGQSSIAAAGEKREGWGWLAYEEQGQAAWRAYYAYLPRGKLVVEYTLRLNNPGQFQLPGTRVEAMYAPDRYGELPSGSLEVAP